MGTNIRRRARSPPPHKGVYSSFYFLENEKIKKKNGRTKKNTACSLFSGVFFFFFSFFFPPPPVVRIRRIAERQRIKYNITIHVRWWGWGGGAVHGEKQITPLGPTTAAAAPRYPLLKPVYIQSILPGAGTVRYILLCILYYIYLRRIMRVNAVCII